MNFREATPAKVSDDFEEEAGQTFTTQLLCREGLKSKIFTFRLSRRSCWVVRVGVTSGLPSGRGATFTIERGATFTTQLLGRESGVTPGSPPARPPPNGRHGATGIMRSQDSYMRRQEQTPRPYRECAFSVRLGVCRCV